MDDEPRTVVLARKVHDGQFRGRKIGTLFHVLRVRYHLHPTPIFEGHFDDEDVPENGHETCVFSRYFDEVVDGR